MSYNVSVYRKQGGAELVVGSGGDITVQSGGAVTVASGAYLSTPYQTLGSSQTATAICESGVSLLTGTTTGPTYLLGAPSAAGICKWLVLNPTSSGATHRCVVSTSAWSGKATHHAATGDKITLDTSAQSAALLVSSGTSEWRVLTGFAMKEPAIS